MLVAAYNALPSAMAFYRNKCAAHYRNFTTAPRIYERKLLF